MQPPILTEFGQTSQFRELEARTDQLGTKDSSPSPFTSPARDLVHHFLKSKDIHGAQTVNNSTTLVDDTDLWHMLHASEEAVFEFCLTYYGVAADDLKVSLTAPAGSTLNWCVIGLDAADAISFAGGFTSGSTTAFGTAITKRIALLKGRVKCGLVAGRLQLQWAQNTAQVADTILAPESYLEATHIRDGKTKAVL